MENYELVLLLDSSVKEADREKFLSDFESKFKDYIVQKDNIWLKNLVYPIKGNLANDKAYLYSYYLNIETSDVKLIWQEFLYNKLILKYDVFRRNKNEINFEFEKLQKDLQVIIDSREEKKLWQKISFFSDLKYSKYINRKSVVMLKKYITRFGNIKPRKYTNNSLSTQKKLRREIIRARNFGLIEFIK